MARKSDERDSSLGGIGTMLTQWEVCPACGRIHADGTVEYFAGEHTQVAGAWEGLPASSVDFPDPLSVTLSHGTRGSSRRARSASIPWPMPPMLERYP
ncbi:MAG: hypothetical protein L3J93_03835 [Thermoplasmata archaeon]|nr:hypothetical protein [Thermoplasmata archaeon]